jgi:hypothetical protein
MPLKNLAGLRWPGRLTGVEQTAAIPVPDAKIVL